MRFTHAALGLRPFTMQDRSQAAMLQRSLQTFEGGRPTFFTDFFPTAFGPSFAPAVKADTSQAKATSTDEAHVEHFTMQDGFARLPGLRWCSSHMHNVVSTSATAAPHSFPLHDVEEWLEDAADEQQQVPAAAADAQDAADQQPLSDSERSSAGALSMPAHINAERLMQAWRSKHVCEATSRPIKLQFSSALQSPTMMGGASDGGASSCAGSALHSVYNSSSSSDEDEAGSCDDSMASAACQSKLAADLNTGSRSRGVAFPTGMQVFPTHPLLDTA